MRVRFSCFSQNCLKASTIKRIKQVIAGKEKSDCHIFNAVWKYGVDMIVLLASSAEDLCAKLSCSASSRHTECSS